MRLQFGTLTFDPHSRQVFSNRMELHLSPKAFELLALLIERRPHAVSKQQIHDHLWPGVFVSSSSLPTLVSEIREAIGDRRHKPRWLRTVHGFGYAFQPPVTTGPQPGLEPTAPRGWLLGEVAEIALQIGENVIGREGPDVILLKSSTVSRRHARIVIDENGAVLEDLASKNGIYVNDQRVTAPMRIVEGDQIRVGSLLFTFRVSQATGSTETVGRKTRLLP